MKKLFYTLAFALLTVAAAQAQFQDVVLNGTVANTNGTNIPFYVSIDDSTSYNTIHSDSSGFFTDTLPTNVGQGTVFLWYFDCTGTAQYQNLSYGPSNMTLNLSIDYCPNGNNPITVNIYGMLNNTNGAIVPVTFITDYAPNGVTADIANGSFIFTIQVNSLLDPVTGYFTDCTGAVQTVQANPQFGTTNLTFNADYCADTTNPDPCGTLFTASYDANANAFTLVMDSSVQNALNTYQWNFGDGSTSTDQYPTHVYANNGVYNVCLQMAQPGGGVCTYCHEIGIDSTGSPVLREDATGFTVNVVAFGTALGVNAPSQSAFDVYPNPIGDNASVSLYMENATACTVDVFNAAGQRVKTFNEEATAGANTLRLPMQDLTKGMYLMTVRFDGKSISRSFVK